MKTHQTDIECMLNHLTENGFNLNIDIIDSLKSHTLFRISTFYNAVQHLYRY
jgi:hypothetical protein